MTHFYLIRHGQASFGQSNYDKLSDLGHQQSRWLGTYFKERHIQFDHIMQGTLTRHSETVSGILEGVGHALPVTTHADLDEFDFATLMRAYIDFDKSYSFPQNAAPKDYFRLLRTAMHAWAGNHLDKHHSGENWQAFESRTQRALSDLCRSEHKQVLVVTSGGVIGMILKHILLAEAATAVSLNLQIKNASITQCIAGKNNVYMSSFNGVPHLDKDGREHAITYS